MKNVLASSGLALHPQHPAFTDAIQPFVALCTSCLSCLVPSVSFFHGDKKQTARLRPVGATPRTHHISTGYFRSSQSHLALERTA